MSFAPRRCIVTRQRPPGSRRDSASASHQRNKASMPSGFNSCRWVWTSSQFMKSTRHDKNLASYENAAHVDSLSWVESPSSCSTVNASLRHSPPEAAGLNRPRSEEHTSELQSRENLVCRLLLEKKKK